MSRQLIRNPTDTVPARLGRLAEDQQEPVVLKRQDTLPSLLRRSDSNTINSLGSSEG